MKSELERLKEDRDQSECEMEHIDTEMRQFEIDHPEDFEDHEDYERLVDEHNELTNWVAYLTACIESIEGGYEE